MMENLEKKNMIQFSLCKMANNERNKSMVNNNDDHSEDVYYHNDRITAHHKHNITQVPWLKDHHDQQEFYLEFCLSLSRDLSKSLSNYFKFCQLKNLKASPEIGLFGLSKSQKKDTQATSIDSSSSLLSLSLVDATSALQDLHHSDKKSFTPNDSNEQISDYQGKKRTDDEKLYSTILGKNEQAKENETDFTLVRGINKFLSLVKAEKLFLERLKTGENAEEMRFKKSHSPHLASTNTTYFYALWYSILNDRFVSSILAQVSSATQSSKVDCILNENETWIKLKTFSNWNSVQSQYERNLTECLVDYEEEEEEENDTDLEENEAVKLKKRDYVYQTSLSSPLLSKVKDIALRERIEDEAVCSLDFVQNVLLLSKISRSNAIGVNRYPQVILRIVFSSSPFLQSSESSANMKEFQKQELEHIFSLIPMPILREMLKHQIILQVQLKSDSPIDITSIYSQMNSNHSNGTKNLEQITTLIESSSSLHHVTNFSLTHENDPQTTANHKGILNLDVTTLISICSDITNRFSQIPSSAYNVPALRSQQESEAKVPFLPIIRQWIRDYGQDSVVCTEHCLLKFANICKLIAGPFEKARGKSLFRQSDLLNLGILDCFEPKSGDKKPIDLHSICPLGNDFQIQVVKDHPSSYFQKLEEYMLSPPDITNNKLQGSSSAGRDVVSLNKKINHTHILIFGTADNYGWKTVSSNRMLSQLIADRKWWFERLGIWREHVCQVLVHDPKSFIETRCKLVCDADERKHT